MIIKAKFNSKCAVCSKELKVGQEVSWNPGSKATCLECEGKTPKTLPGKTKITKLKFGKKEVYQISFYWPFKAVVFDVVEIENVWGDEQRLYKKIPLIFDSKELTQDFINNQLADHWYKLDQCEIVQGI